MFFFKKKRYRYAKYYFWQPAEAKKSVHFLPIITIPQVNLNFVCVYSAISHIKNVLVTSIHITPVNS